MQRDDARLQMLTLAMFGVLALLVFDFQPVEEAMTDLGLGAGDDAIAAEEPAPTPWATEGPSLAVGGEKPKVPAKPCGPGEIAVDTPAAELSQQWTDALCSPDTSRAPETGIHVTKLPQRPTITSMWPTRGDARPPWTSLAGAAEELGLTPEQRESWQRTIEDAARDLDDLRHVPDAEGRTFHSITSGWVAAPAVRHREVARARALADFLTRELNGGETYIEAYRRILEGHEDRLRTELTPEQQATFDAYDVTGVLDPAGGLRPMRLTAGIRLQRVKHDVRIRVAKASS